MALSEEPGLEMICAPANGGGCDCAYSLDLPDSQNGTWNLFDDGLLLTSEAGESLGVFDYCVDAGRFSMWIPLYEQTAFPEIRCTEDDDCEGRIDDGFDAAGCDAPEDEER